MRDLAQRFKAEELAVVRDFMREAKEIFLRQVGGQDTEVSHGVAADEGGESPVG
jgi:hypothetical protein